MAQGASPWTPQPRSSAARDGHFGPVPGSDPACGMPWQHRGRGRRGGAWWQGWQGSVSDSTKGTAPAEKQYIARAVCGKWSVATGVRKSGLCCLRTPNAWGPRGVSDFWFRGPAGPAVFFEVDGVQFESVAVYLILEAKINQGNRNSLRKYEHTSGPRKPPTSSQGALTPRPKNWRSL